MGLEVKSYIDKGEVVPLYIAKKVIERFITSNEAIVVIDAFPRNMEQIVMFEEILISREDIHLKGVIEIVVDDEQAKERIRKRNRGVDDDISLFENRMKVYNNEISAIRQHYSQKGLYQIIDGNKSIAETKEKLTKVFEK